MRKEAKTVYLPLVDSLRKIMIEKEITQSALAEYAGISTSQFSKVMNGAVGLSIPQVANIARALNMELIDIFTYPEVYIPEKKKQKSINAVLQLTLSDIQRDKVLNAIFDKDLVKALNEQ